MPWKDIRDVIFSYNGLLILLDPLILLKTFLKFSIFWSFNKYSFGGYIFMVSIILDDLWVSGSITLIVSISSPKKSILKAQS